MRETWKRSSLTETYYEGGRHSDFTVEQACALVERTVDLAKNNVSTSRCLRLLSNYKHADLTVEQARDRVG